MDSNPKAQPYPEAFFFQVKQILENFYDFPFLNRHPLAHSLKVSKLRPSETDGQRLRRVFLAGLDELKPEDTTTARSIQARFHRLLELRYLESNTMPEVARALGVSERQAYRDLKRAEESLAAVLWAELAEALGNDFDGGQDGTAPAAQEPEADELETIEVRPSMVSAQELLQNALRAVERLAEKNGIPLVTEIPSETVTLYTDPILAQQVLINLISKVLQAGSTRKLTIRLLQNGNDALIQLECSLDPCEECLDSIGLMVNQLVQRLGWVLLSQVDGEHNVQRIDLRTGGKEALLLVIDDNPALIELLRRYLTNKRCQIVGVNDGVEGLKAAQEMKPDVIFLDVMMPGTDGWEILQRIKASPEVKEIPVVVCSIFNDPGLAASLGAEHTLPKPVKREELFHLLDQLRIG